MAEKQEKKVYDFGEKKEEVINGVKVPVEFHTPKYKEAKAKAIELLESKEYKDVLRTSDFWILVNSYSNKTKAMYSGLIISHDGCLKINDSLSEELRFKPECLSLDKDGYNNSLVYTYNCKEQGLYEVGEVSPDNLRKGGYPYAMALKRCFDRVVLKNSKIAYAGIYSDSESDEFIKRNEEDSQSKEKTNNKLNYKPISGTEKQVLDLMTKMKSLVIDTNSDMDLILNWYKVKSNTEMTLEQLQDCVRNLEIKLQNKKMLKESGQEV